MVDIIQNISCGLSHNRDHSMTSVPNQDPKGDFYLWQCAPQQPHMTTTCGRPPRTCRVVTFTTIRAGRSAPLSLYLTRHSWNKQLTHTHLHVGTYLIGWFVLLWRGTSTIISEQSGAMDCHDPKRRCPLKHNGTSITGMT